MAGTLTPRSSAAGNVKTGGNRTIPVSSTGTSAGSLTPRNSDGGPSKQAVEPGGDKMANSGASGFVRGHIQANVAGKPHAATFGLHQSSEQSLPNAQTAPISAGNRNAKVIQDPNWPGPGSGQAGYDSGTGGSNR